jgi:endonuclease/exonuclease/phosphatase (EEP) superfamily protein YafD
LASLTPLVQRLGAPVLLLGDLNASPWSYPFRRLLEGSGLRDGSLGRGFQPTWPTGLWPLLIPLDHSLHSAGIGIQDRIVGPAVGSDHYPVIVDFTVSE